MRVAKQLQLTSTSAAKARLASPLGEATDLLSVRAHTRILHQRTILSECCLTCQNKVITEKVLSRSWVPA